jgi:hypothetical protein
MLKFIAVILSLALALAQPATPATADVCGLKATEIIGYVIDSNEHLVPFAWVQVEVGRRISCRDGTPIVYYDVQTDADGYYSCVYSSKPFSDFLLVQTTIPGQGGGITSGSGSFEYGDPVCNVSCTVDVID